MAIESWSLVRVYGTWADHSGAKLPGKYEVSIPVRLTNSADDLILPKGVVASGELVVAAGVPSLSILCPSTDDPDIQQDGWKLQVTITFTGGQDREIYTIDVPVADRPLADGGTGAGVNLRTIALSANLPPQAAMYGVGRPSGLALLSEDGTAVLDAYGAPITGGGGATSVEDLTDATNVGKDLVTASSAAIARAAIGAQVAGSYLTSVPDATATTKGIAQLATTAEAAAGTLSTKAVTPAGVKAAVDALVAGAPGALDTLNELAAALGGDAAFSATVASSLASRVRTDTASQGLTSTQQANARANVDAAPVAQSVVFSTSTTRPTARTDVMVIFRTAADPGSNALDGDWWEGA